MNTLTAIPVIAQRTIALFALFDAALHARPFSLDFHEPHTPGSGAALLAWAKANGLPVVERWFASQNGYVNLRVSITASCGITVLAHRLLTAEEMASLVDGVHREVVL